ncbi:TIGR04141 family sporadically distributed protein [Olivibacter sp. 47]|uniref:DUF6119 family protein n=1 Tax=Olivibacter sp. 47 TaxID=3056486 RepID=UPI0025A3CF57|nr:DUF6119 family protein [Olivibacter sp. 47]MDM8173172.1 TIGR04141 family sporadically distributed protein [Olivibacter sp. 47]
MTIYPNIYRIDKNHRDLKQLRNNEAVMKRIIKSSYKKNEWKENSDAPLLNSYQKDNFIYHLYLYNTDEKTSEWASFLPSSLAKDSRFLQKKLSLILFVETEFELFAVVGGNAFRMIIPFIDQSFGLNTYDRIIEINEDELSSMRSRGITGQRMAANEQYREDYRIINYMKFGKVPQELHVKLSESTSKLYFPLILDKENERLQIAVGRSFKIRKSVTFNYLHQVLEDLLIVLSMPQKEYLSSYIEISDEDSIQKLQDVLHEKIYNNIRYALGETYDPRDRFEFDFCNPNNIEKFYEAEKYVLKEKTEDSHRVFSTVFDRSEIYRTVIRRAYELHGNNAFQIKVFLNGVRVLGYLGSKSISSSTFMYHISAELNYENKPVFLIDTKWYHLKEVFISDLKTQTERVLCIYKAPKTVLKLPWDKNLLKREGDYNLQYDPFPDYIVIDSIISDGVELCDILHYDDNNLYLIHVKYGFDSKIRELTNQVLISARRLSEALGAGNISFFDRLYDILKKKNRNVNGLTKEEFAALFSKNITYILAVTSHLKDDCVIEENIDKFESNIARFSLVTCSSDIRNYFEMLTYQIHRA